MKKFLAITLAILAVLCILTIPAYAGEAEAESMTQEMTEAVTGAEAIPTDPETGLPFDEWIYQVMQEATPDQVELIEEIVLGGLNALDKLEIDGFDRVRIWVEHNMATVLTVLLIAALIAFFVVTVLQKRGFGKKADILNSNAIEIYEAGQEAMARSEKVSRECMTAAKEAASEAKAAHGQVAEERAMLIAELEKSRQANMALCEIISFLLQCSDLSVTKRDEAEAIYKKAQEAMSHDHTDEA